MADTWKVVRRRVDGSFSGNAVFEGTEDDARRWLSDNFPRVHVEPNTPDSGSPDALLVSPDGDHEACVGTQGIGNAVLPHFIDVDDRGVPLDSEEQDETEADDETVESVKSTPAKKTAAAKKTAPPKF